MGELLVALLVVLLTLSWVLPRRFRGDGLAAFYLLVFPVAVALMFVIQHRSRNPTNSIDEGVEFVLVMSAICLIGTAPLSFLAMRKPTPAVWNPRISVYWLWLVVVFATIAAMPCLPSALTGEPRRLPVAAA